MDGIHDLGGLEGFGAVVVHQDEPVFESPWERRVFGLTFNAWTRGLCNGGQWRHAIERMDPVHYLTSRYYEHWFTALAGLLVDAGIVDVAELEQRAGGPVPLPRPVAADAASAASAAAAAVRPGAGFGVGDRVRVRDVQRRGHTRCPRYVRGRTGTVVRVDPAAPVPDVEAHHPAGAGSEPVYCVRFAAGELWGTAEPGVHVHVDLWQRYLEAA